jgi:hypothetical protein
MGQGFGLVAGRARDLSATEAEVLLEGLKLSCGATQRLVSVVGGDRYASRSQIVARHRRGYPQADIADYPRDQKVAFDSSVSVSSREDLI